MKFGWIYWGGGGGGKGSTSPQYCMAHCFQYESSTGASPVLGLVTTCIRVTLILGTEYLVDQVLNV